MIQAVVGLGFGDEGKGLTTSFLAHQDKTKPLIIRHNGGQQAGHTVFNGKRKHVFSQIGSGAFEGCPTFFTRDCTFYPPAFLDEYSLLKDIKPKVYLDPETMITLSIDIDFNRVLENRLGENRHGSVGMGFGATIERNSRHFNIFAKDMLYPKVLRAKIENIYKHYYKIKDLEGEIDRFMNKVSEVVRIVEIVIDVDLLSKGHSIIYESAQGLLLDQHHGFFPNVTRSNTGTKNLRISPSEIYYVTRTYQTRHGAGFMTNEDSKPKLVNNESETNTLHDYQGEFRIADLDIELLKYALSSDIRHHRHSRRNLVITCNDQLAYDIDYIIYHLGKVPGFMGFHRILLSYGPRKEDIIVYRGSY